MAADSNYFAALLARAARGESLTPKDRLLLDILLGADEHLLEQWERQEVPVEEMWANIMAHMASTANAQGGSGAVKVRGRLNGFVRVRVAAAVAVCIGIGVWFFARSVDRRAPVAAVSSDARWDTVPGGAEVIFQASNKETADIRVFPIPARVNLDGDCTLQRIDSDAAVYEQLDGQPASAVHSVVVGRGCGPFVLRFSGGDAVWLNAGSILTYSPESETAGRKVRLQGEAFFTIIKDQRSPFTVVTPSGDSIQVLGTAFAVKSSRAANDDRVAVYSGAVRLSSTRGAGIVVRSQQEVRMDDRGIGRRHFIGTPSALPEWVQAAQYFRFKNTDMNAAVERIAGWYGLGISNPKHLAGGPISGDLDRRETVENLLKAMEKITGRGIHLERRGDTIFVSSKIK